MDKSVTAVVIQGLAEHKDTLGAPLCPCRHYDDKEAEAAQGFWNCPCVPMRERKVRAGWGRRRMAPRACKVAGPAPPRARRQQSMRGAARNHAALAAAAPLLQPPRC